MKLTTLRHADRLPRDRAVELLAARSLESALLAATPEQLREHAQLMASAAHRDHCRRQYARHLADLPGHQPLTPTHLHSLASITRQADDLAAEVAAIFAPAVDPAEVERLVREYLDALPPPCGGEPADGRPTPAGLTLLGHTAAPTYVDRATGEVVTRDRGGHPVFRDAEGRLFLRDRAGEVRGWAGELRLREQRAATPAAV